MMSWISQGGRWSGKSKNLHCNCKVEPPNNGHLRVRENVLCIYIAVLSPEARSYAKCFFFGANKISPVHVHVLDHSSLALSADSVLTISQKGVDSLYSIFQWNYHLYTIGHDIIDIVQLLYIIIYKQ